MAFAGSEIPAGFLLGRRCYVRKIERLMIPISVIQLRKEKIMTCMLIENMIASKY